MTQRTGVWMVVAVVLEVGSGGCAPQAALPPRPSFSGSGSPPLLSTTPIAPRPDPAPIEPDAVAGLEWLPEADERAWRSIVLHHTATRRGSVESIHESHLKRQWLGIGYHFVVGNGDGMGDGEIEPTFRWRQQIQGAHAGDEEYNEYGIGIALVGNFDEQPPSPAQLEAVKGLVASLQATYNIADERVIGHNEVKATACPGRLLPLAEIRTAGRDQLLGRHP